MTHQIGGDRVEVQQCQQQHGPDMMIHVQDNEGAAYHRLKCRSQLRDTISQSPSIFYLKQYHLTITLDLLKQPQHFKFSENVLLFI